MRAPLAAVTVTILCAVLAADTPAENRDRAAAIRATITEITQECERYAAGDWTAWYLRNAAFRNELRPRVEASMDRVAAYKANPATVPSPLLRASTTPPIYELPSYAMYLLYLNDNDPVKWVRELSSAKAFIEISHWLRQRNIDLLLVPTPRMAEVYPDLLAGGVPPEKIVAPQMRRLFLDLSQADVEVVDLLPIFLKARQEDPEPLYLVADGHWSDRAQRLAAAEVGRRLKRYDVVKTALRQPARFTSTPSHAAFQGAIFDMLTPPERDQVKGAVAAMNITKVTTPAGVPFEEPVDSPVLVIGDSFTHYFQLGISKGTGIDALLSKAINLPVSNVSTAGGTVDPIKELLRRPALLQGRRAVVWILNNSLLSYPPPAWDVPPLPK